jgi:serine/threonine protein kinase
MALIEAGNLDGLALGPLRVIDRLRATAREVVYRVFDPRSNQEALLRHLSESILHEPGHAEEFRRRFTEAAALRHPSLAASWEVLDIAGRPAVLQEYVAGVASGDWPPLVAAPGVWYRLLCQTTLGLQTGHQAGLVHGHLDAGQIVLTQEGIVKLAGFGEPAWLATPSPNQIVQPTVEDDLRALGQLAASWAAAGGEAKRPRGKPLPPELQKILQRLTADEETSRYADAVALLEDLDAAGATVPANSTAWERFVKQVREQSSHEKPTKRSA